jgi:hypothetical protein
MSVMVTLTFTNPLYSGASGADSQPQTLSLTRVVTVMNQSGVVL